jgi:hypothetical protein
MTAEKKKDKIEYSYNDIITIHFEVSEHPYDIEDILNNLKLNFGTVFSSNIEDETLIFDIEIGAEAELEENIQCFLIRLRNIFSIKDLEKFKNSEGNLSILKDHLVLFASLSYSSARGVLHEKLAFSRYKKEFLLPVIEPNKLVKGMDFENIEPIGKMDNGENT